MRGFPGLSRLKIDKHLAFQKNEILSNFPLSRFSKFSSSINQKLKKTKTINSQLRNEEQNKLPSKLISSSRVYLHNGSYNKRRLWTLSRITLFETSRIRQWLDKKNFLFDPLKIISSRFTSKTPLSSRSQESVCHSQSLLKKN